MARGVPKQKISTAAGGRNSRKRMQNATPCRRPVLLLPRSLPCSASTLCMRARSWSSCSIGLLRTRLVSWPTDSNKNPRPGPPGASTFPRIWNRSIVVRENPVKRKTQNVGTVRRKCSICSGVISRTRPFFAASLVREHKKFPRARHLHAMPLQRKLATPIISCTWNDFVFLKENFFASARNECSFGTT
jgi:hypothetical protein